MSISGISGAKNQSIPTPHQETRKEIKNQLK
jgi:hypothetical protein